MPIKLPSFRARRDAYPPDLWTKCPSCEEMLFNKQLDKVQRVCPSCGHHFRLSAEARLAHLLDHGTFVEHDAGLTSVDPLGFVDQKAYPDRIAAAQLATGMKDAAVWGTGTIDGRPVAICVMDFGFMGGSMGAVVGEKVTRAAEHALDPSPAAHRRLGVGRGADAGGDAGADAAREDRRRARAAPGRRRAVHQRPVRPDDRRRVRLVRGARRRQRRRAERADRLRRRAGHVRDDRPGAAGRVPALGVPVRARLPRPGRPPLRAAVGAVRPPRRTSCRRPAANGTRGRAGAARPAVVPAALVPLEPRRAGHAERAVAAARRTASDGRDAAAKPPGPDAAPSADGASLRSRPRRRAASPPSPDAGAAPSLDETPTEAPRG